MIISRDNMRVIKRVARLIVIKSCPLIALASLILLIGAMNSFEIGELTISDFVTQAVVLLVLFAFGMSNLERN